MYLSIYIAIWEKINQSHLYLAQNSYLTKCLVYINLSSQVHMSIYLPFDGKPKRCLGNFFPLDFNILQNEDTAGLKRAWTECQRNYKIIIETCCLQRYMKGIGFSNSSGKQIISNRDELFNLQFKFKSLAFEM